MNIFFGGRHQVQKLNVELCVVPVPDLDVPIRFYRVLSFKV